MNWSLILISNVGSKTFEGLVWWIWVGQPKGWLVPLCYIVLTTLTWVHAATTASLPHWVARTGPLQGSTCITQMKDTMVITILLWSRKDWAGSALDKDLSHCIYFMTHWLPGAPVGAKRFCTTSYSRLCFKGTHYSINRLHFKNKLQTAHYGWYLNHSIQLNRTITYLITITLLLLFFPPKL